MLSFPFPSNVFVYFPESAEISSLSGRLSEPSLFPWHLSLNNQHWRRDSSCIPGRSSGGVLTADCSSHTHPEQRWAWRGRICCQNIESKVWSVLAMKVWAFARPRDSFLDTGSPFLVSLRWAAGVGVGVGVGGQAAVWAITAVITVFPVTLQANAMWKRLIHGSQVLNTATPPAAAVIPTPPPPGSLTPSIFHLCSHHRHSCLEGRRKGAEGREGAVITWGSKTGCGQQRDISSFLFLPNQRPSSSHTSKAAKCFSPT